MFGGYDYFFYVFCDIKFILLEKIKIFIVYECYIVIIVMDSDFENIFGKIWFILVVLCYGWVVYLDFFDFVIGVCLCGLVVNNMYISVFC